MQRKLLSLLLAGVCASALAGAAAPTGNKVWITVGERAYQQLRLVAPQAIGQEDSRVMSLANGGNERVHAVEVDADVLGSLSQAVHENLHRCGGFMVHLNETEARAVLTKPAAKIMATRPSYTIDNQATVNPLLAQMTDANIATTITNLSSSLNRYYTSSQGVAASNWLVQYWQQLAAGRSDVTVEQFTHSWAMKSVVMTIQGTDNGSEVVILGGHLDSINQSGGSAETMKAPGADDDASGIASLSEAARVMLSSGYKPRRTIKFIGYSGEEEGLLGSQAIAKQYKSQNVNVVGVMQLDMTNYKGSANDIYIYSDYTDSQQNTFVSNLITTYQPTLKIGTDKCGYACSDHASWNSQGYAASMPFEAAMGQDDPYIHSANDTFANTGSQALHALKFAKLALSYAVELGSDGPGGNGGGDQTQTYSGSVAKGAKQNYGPIKAGAGTFTVNMTGTGDADLYVRKGSAPTTSSYDCRPYKSGSAESCSLTLTGNTDVYIMVNGYAAATYNLAVTYKGQ